MSIQRMITGNLLYQYEYEEVLNYAKPIVNLSKTDYDFYHTQKPSIYSKFWERDSIQKNRPANIDFYDSCDVLTTYHDYENPNEFIPTLQEVFNQIPSYMHLGLKNYMPFYFYLQGPFHKGFSGKKYGIITDDGIKPIDYSYCYNKLFHRARLYIYEAK
jgi:hypothetical protein